jgi:hypothetical protein
LIGSHDFPPVDDLQKQTIVQMSASRKGDGKKFRSVLCGVNGRQDQIDGWIVADETGDA